MNVEAFGQDFLEKVPDGTVFLSSPTPKGWLARQEGTATRAEHPGTAVRWQDDVFEVLKAWPLPDGGIRYKLAPWDFRHAIRVMQPYDASAEQVRVTEHGRRRKSLWKRRLAILFSPVLGHLPGSVQEAMESEFGAPARAMTIVSALPLFVLATVNIFSTLLTTLGGQEARLRVWVLPLPIGLYLLVESGVRIGAAIAGGHPMGSLLGVLLYELAVRARGRKPSRLAYAGTPPSQEQAIQDTYRMLEPLLALLPSEEQKSLEHRFGFDPLRWGRITAVCLLVFSALGVLTATKALLERVGGLGDALVLLVSAALLFEQVHRQRELARGDPSGSVLGRLVRPAARNLLQNPSDLK